MSNLREAAQQALEALEGVFEGDEKGAQYWTVTGGTYEAVECKQAITALRAALEQPVQPPCDIAEDGVCETLDCCGNPPSREWRSLSDDELTALGIIHSRYQEESLETGGWFDFARAIEAALKERNA